MSAVAAPTVEIGLSAAAAEEIKKFLAGEDDLPETADFACASCRAAVPVFNTA
jgi:hypothetical protein